MGKASSAIAAAAVLFAPGIHADSVILDNGDRITGTVVRKQDQNLVVKTPYAGEITIQWDAVARIETEAPVEVMLEDDTVLRATLIPADEGTVILKAGDLLQTAPIDKDLIAHINPPPEVSGRGVRFSGRIDIGAAVATGNTDTRTVHLDAEAVARTRENRYTVGARALHNEEDGRENADNTFVYSKYDHFLSERRYLYANASFERDDFKDLNLRSALGAGVGHQFVETKHKNLSLEGGLTHVNDDFDVAEDDSYFAARWAVNYDQYLWHERIQVFHRHEGLLSVENSEDVIIRSQSGLRLPWTANLNTSVQLNADWDRSPPPGTESTDLTYLLNVGYNW